MLFFGSWSLFFVILVHKQNAQNPCIESETVVHNWNVTTLINNGWTQCYSYGFYTTGPNSTIEATLDSCPTEYDSYFFVGTLESLHSTNVILGAFGPSSVLSEYTISKKTAFLPNVYNTTSYSVYWYNYPVYLASGIGAFGFSSIPEISISVFDLYNPYFTRSGDTSYAGNSENRLSWSWLNGGYRVGNSMDYIYGNSIYNYYKIIYYKQCETPPTPAPTAGSIKFTDTFGVLPFKNYGMIPALDYNDTFILLFGGSVYQQSLTKFDVENNKFENNNLYAFPEAIAMSSSQSYTQIDEDTIYIMSANNVFAIFDIMTQEITSHLFMSSKYSDGACLTHYNNYLIVSYLNVIQIYDTLNYFWISLDLIPDSIGLSSRRYHSCNVVGDYLYQIGGVLIKYYGSDQFRRTVEKSTSTVEKLYLGGMSENLFSKPTVLYLSNAKHATSSVVFQDKIIFVIGGRTLDSDYYYSDIDAIYTETDYIESYDVLEYKIAAAAVIIVGDILHVFGGSDSHNDTHDFAVNYYQYVNLATIVADECGETDDTIPYYVYQLIPFIGSAIFIVTLCYIAFVCCRCGHSKQGDHKSAIEMASYSPTTGRASSAGNASLDTSYTKRGITLEFIISITLYVMDCIDGYTSIIVAEEYRKGPITPCTAGVGETYDFEFVATLIIIMTIVGFIFSTLDTIMYLQETCCWCEKNPQARIMNHIKIEIILNIFQDLAVSWLTMYIGLSVGHVSDAFVTSIVINCCVSLLYLIKNLMELWGMFGKIYKKFCTCCEGEHWDVRNAVINGCGSVKYISWTFILLSVATVATLMCLRYGGVETGNAAYNSNLVIDDVEYVDWVKYKGHYLTVPNLYDPTGNGHDTKDCYITCEDIMEDYGIVKCEVSKLYEINGCSCTDTYIDIDECNTMICNGYSFEICYGTCSIN